MIEDLHWADSSTAEIVDYLARRVKSSQILLLVTCRDEEIHRLPGLAPVIKELRRNPSALIVEVKPLSVVETAKMLAAILGMDDLPVPMPDAFHARTEGSPLVIEEMLKAALDGGQIARSAAGWNLEGLADLKLPRTVQGMTLARLEGLDPQLAELLRWAAVVGDVVDYDFLRELSGLEDASLETAIAQCVHDVAPDRAEELLRSSAGVQVSVLVAPVGFCSTAASAISASPPPTFIGPAT